MKITAVVTAANSHDRWGAAFPIIDCEKCFPILNGKMTAQPDECFRELAASDMIQGVDYREPYLNQIVASWIRYVNGWKDENCIGKDAPELSKTEDRIHRRIERGKSTHVRAVWHTKKDGGISLSIVHNNNDNVVEIREYERLFAWKMAEAANVVNEDLADRGLPIIAFDESVTTLLKELEEWRVNSAEEKKMKELNENRFVCKHHRNGFCVASADGELPDFKCPCYCKGNCTEAKR